jgi:hypothetical protein
MAVRPEKTASLDQMREFGCHLTDLERMLGIP